MKDTPSPPCGDAKDVVAALDATHALLMDTEGSREEREVLSLPEEFRLPDDVRPDSCRCVASASGELVVCGDFVALPGGGALILSVRLVHKSASVETTAKAINRVCKRIQKVGQKRVFRFAGRV